MSTPYSATTRLGIFLFDMNIAEMIYRLNGTHGSLMMDDGIRLPCLKLETGNRSNPRRLFRSVDI